MLSIRNPGQVVNVAGILTLMLAAYACSEDRELSVSEAKIRIIASDDYQSEVWDDFAVSVQFLKNRSGVADNWVAEMMENKVAASFKTTQLVEDNSIFRTDMVLSESAQLWVRGPEEERGDVRVIPVVNYNVEFGEITSIRYVNTKKTQAVVEFTEFYEPTIFASLSRSPISGVFPKDRQTYPETARRELTLLLHGDAGWRVEN